MPCTNEEHRDEHPRERRHEEREELAFVDWPERLLDDAPVSSAKSSSSELAERAAPGARRSAGRDDRRSRMLSVAFVSRRARRAVLRPGARDREGVGRRQRILTIELREQSSIFTAARSRLDDHRGRRCSRPAERRLFLRRLPRSMPSAITSLPFGDDDDAAAARFDLAEDVRGEQHRLLLGDSVRITSRTSRIWFGSRPAVGSSSTRSGGIARRARRRARRAADSPSRGCPMSDVRDVVDVHLASSRSSTNDFLALLRRGTRLSSARKREVLGDAHLRNRAAPTSGM